VFSLGCVLAYAATGKAPYGSGNAASVLHRIVNGRPDLAWIPARLREVVIACLARNPAERPGLTHLSAWISRAGPGVPGGSPGAFWHRPTAAAQASLEQDRDLSGAPHCPVRRPHRQRAEHQRAAFQITTDTVDQIKANAVERPAFDFRSCEHGAASLARSHASHPVRRRTIHTV
jgi:serine/threonine protein kinase